jgi:hypothetical protein
MSTARRAYDIMRGYVNREWERIQGVALSDAEQELEASLEPGSLYEKPKAADAVATTVSHRPLDEARAREVLGVAPDANFAEIRAAFERITKRSDPANFPAGSPESKQAEDIHRRVHRAYDLLTEGMDATEKRFRSLEID